MTKSKLIMLAAMAMLAACSKIDDPQLVVDCGECKLSVNFACDGTKATGQTNEKEDKVNNVSVFVFRTDDGHKLDASGYADDGTTEMEIKCTIGEKKVYVLVNAAEDFTNTVRCESDLLAQKTRLIENGCENLFMMGDETQSLVGPTSTLTVPVTRLVASVKVEKITNMMEAKAYRGNGLFKVDAIYLTNVVGSWAYDGSTNPQSLADEEWMARLVKEDSPLICDANVNQTVNYEQSMTDTHTFYAFPNNCAVDESETWSKRSTMLVVEATLDGVKYYYPCAVGPLERNRQYVISEIIIRRPGSNYPWQAVHKTDATVKVEITQWSQPVTTNEDI